MYVIRMSGKGKSKFLESCLYQDIAAGHGCVLIVRHSLLADDVHRLFITQETLYITNIRDRLICVDPAHTDYVMPINVIVIPGEHPYDMAATVLEASWRTWPECLKEAPHFSHAVTASLIDLINNDLTLMHLPRTVP